MMNSKKPSKTLLAPKRWASALLVVLFTSLAVPTFAIAQDDAGAVAPAETVAAPVAAPAPAPAAEAPAEAPPEAVVADAPAPAVVAPAEPAAQTSLDKLSSELMNILIPVFVTLIGGLAVAFLAWVRKKLKLDVSNQQIYQWSEVAELAAGRGGEWLRNKVKEGTEDKKIPGPEVLEVAVNWGLDYGIAHGLPDIGREKLGGLIESKLHLKRLAKES